VSSVSADQQPEEPCTSLRQQSGELAQQLPKNSIKTRCFHRIPVATDSLIWDDWGTAKSLREAQPTESAKAPGWPALLRAARHPAPEATPRDTRARPAPSRSRRYQPTKADRACALGQPARPVSRWRSLPGPRGSRSLPMWFSPRKTTAPVMQRAAAHRHGVARCGRDPPSGARCMLGVVVLKAASSALQRWGLVLGPWEPCIPAFSHARSPCELPSDRSP